MYTLEEKAKHKNQFVPRNIVPRFLVGASNTYWHNSYYFKYTFAFEI